MGKYKPLQLKIYLSKIKMSNLAKKLKNCWKTKDKMNFSLKEKKMKLKRAINKFALYKKAITG